MKALYLSKRNLLTLLSKLERLENGEQTACSLVKYRNPVGKYIQSDEAVLIMAVPDNEYYADQQRPAGVVHPSDDPNKEFIEP